MTSKEPLSIRVISSMKEVDKAQWNSLVSPSGPGKQSMDTGGSAGAPANPFVTHEFLSALEESGSAVPQTGWYSQHLLLEDGGQNLLGALPCYLKSHSQGEYVFDHGWADAYERAGGRYYPKLQSCVPFTPATGPRFLVGEAENQIETRALLANGLCQLGEKIGVSSAHITFMEKDDWELAGQLDYLQRTDQQFHWHNRKSGGPYVSFDDFLADLSSRKRKNIRKERATALQGNGIEIDWLTGSDLTEGVWDAFFDFYMDTGSRKWGSPYLTREFFSRVGETMAGQILLVMARRNGHYIAGAINFLGDNRLFGRNWGCIEDHPCLHFEVCYYQAIDYAIQNRLSCVEAGAQGAHKLARGYVPVTTYSAHWVAHPGLRSAIEDYLVEERRHVELENQALHEHAPYRKTNPRPVPENE